MKDKEQQYEDGYYSAQYIGTNKNLQKEFGIKSFPIEIHTGMVLLIGICVGRSIKEFKNIQPLELPKPKREEGYYLAKVGKGDDKEIIYYDRDINCFFCHGDKIQYFEEYFDWIGLKRIEL